MNEDYKNSMDAFWDDEAVDITSEANFIWGITNKLRCKYLLDRYGDVVIPMTISADLNAQRSRMNMMTVKKSYSKCRADGMQGTRALAQRIAHRCAPSVVRCVQLTAHARHFSL